MKAITHYLFTLTALAFGFSTASADPFYVTTGAGNILNFTAPNTDTVFASGLNNPAGLALDIFGNLFEADHFSNQILKFTAPNTSTVFASGVDHPAGLAFDISGNLYEADIGSGRILKFTAPNTYTVFASGLSSPVSIALDNAQNVYVSEAGTGNILKYTAPNTSTVFASGLNTPRTIAIDPSGKLYVAEDTASGTIRQFTAPNTSTIYASGLNNPYGIAFDKTGNLFVGEQSTIKKFSAPNTSTTYASGLFYPNSFAFAGSGFDRTALAPQNIVLDFDDNVPFSLVSTTVFNKTLSVPLPVGSIAAAHPNQQYRDAVLQEVRDIFAASGVTNINITTTPTQGATTVYFANPVNPNLLGQTLGAPDRFNKHADGTVAVFVNDAATDAETAAHEIGHTLGLRHVDPNSTADPKNQEVMDYDPSTYALPNFVPQFVNAVSPIFDITAFGATHNPLYHLKRYVDGFSDQQLRAQGINPGTWDLQQPIKFHLGFTDSQRMLFNVSLFVGSGAADSLESIAHYDQITLEALQVLEFDIDPGMAISLLASSTSSGSLDVALASGDPYGQNNLFIEPVDGQVSAFLQFQSGTDTYTTLDTATVTGTVVPEPSTTVFGGVGLIGMLIVRRRNRHLTMRCSERLRVSR